MDLDKFTTSAQKCISKAGEIAIDKAQTEIEDLHLFAGVLEEDKNILPYIFEKSNTNTESRLAIKEKIYRAIDDKNSSSSERLENKNPHLSPTSYQTLSRAKEISEKGGDQFIAVEHIIMSLVKVKGIVKDSLKDHGIDEKKINKIITELKKGDKVSSRSAEETYNSLDKYSINLNQAAMTGKLDPVIGREEEIRRVLQILSRRTKNNPILIGDPGVGKTAIIEGLADRIIKGDVPENLKEKIIYSLDMGALIAGAKFKGEFEERLKAVVKDVTQSNGEVVLFIDEIHTLVGAGKSDGAMDAANILKPALARGDLRAIGATTLDEYQKYFEKDKALERRFQKVIVKEPSIDDAMTILRGLKERYETHHKVRIKDEAIVGAVKLSSRYIGDRYLPDKAIDLIDEAAAGLRLVMNSKPVELDQIDRKVMQLEVEREALKNEKKTTQVNKLNLEIQQLKESSKELRARWENEKSIIDKIQSNKEEIEQLNLEADKYVREGNYEKVAEIRYGKIKEAEKVIEENQIKLRELQESNNALLKEEIGEEEIAEVVSRWVGVPITKMLKSERDKLLGLEEILHKRVVGQDRAIEAVSNAIRRNRSGLQEEGRPIGSFIFLGSTGVGKTELAKALAYTLFDDEQYLTRIDMSEFQEKHSVSRLVGAPPGYVGYEESGQLTEAVRHRPYSVILFDEIEKAHPDVFNILLQVLDDGRLTDNKGRLIDFKNTLIIMTSNLGSDIIQEGFDKATKSSEWLEQTETKLLDVLKGYFRPEFLNRIDEITLFHPLSKKEIKEIVGLNMNQLISRLKNKNILFTVTDKAIDYLASHGYEPEFGARPIRRLIQKKVLDELSKKIISDNIKLNQHSENITNEEKSVKYKLDTEGGKLVVK